MKILRYFFLVLLLLVFPKSGKSQLGGIGIYPHFTMSDESGKFKFSGDGFSNSIGGAIYREGYGFFLNTQIGAGYVRKSFNYSDTIGQSTTFSRDYIQIIPSFKYWFVNSIRAGQIFGMKCAHKTKIIYNYTIKPYLIFGMPFEILVKKSKVSEQTAYPFSRTNWSLFGGIGSNLVEMGGNFNPKMIFAEVRLFQDLSRFLTDGPHRSIYSWGIQAVIGLKFERD